MTKNIANRLTFIELSIKSQQGWKLLTLRAEDEAIAIRYFRTFRL